MSKLEKINCEICGETNKETLHAHHIIYRSDLRSDNSNFNLCICCANCHNLIHADRLKIIGVWPSTSIQGRKVIFVKDGTCNVEGMQDEQPPYTTKNESMKLYT